MNYNWVFCAGNRRSGSTVHYHYVRELIEYAGVGRGYGAVPGGAISPQPWRITDTTDDGIKVWRTHRPTGDVKDIIKANPDTKVAYIHRDMRDSLVSTMNHEPHKDFKWFLGNWATNNIANETYWLSLPNVLMTRYEDMFRDPKAEIRRLATFLELDIPDTFVDELYEKYNIKAVKEITSAADEAEELYQKYDKDISGWAVGDGGFRAFTRNHVHNGKWGQFLTELTPDEIRAIEARCKENLVNRGYPLLDDILEHLDGVD